MDENLKRGCAALLKEVINTPYSELFRQVKTQDLEDKKELIKEIETFKALYEKFKDLKVKVIIEELTKELEETNLRIERIKKLNG